MKPVPGGKVTCKYGTPGAWIGGWHRGTDFGGVPTGSPVVAMWDGVVTSANWGPAYGIHVVIDHDKLPDGSPGYWAVYAHLSSRSVKVGQRVRAGERIGSLGSTGNVSGPHTHVEVQTASYWRSSRDGSVTRDPQKWIDARRPKMVQITLVAQSEVGSECDSV